MAIKSIELAAFTSRPCFSSTYLITVVDEGLLMFTDDTKLGRIANVLEYQNKIQNDFDKLEKWDEIAA